MRRRATGPAVLASAALGVWIFAAPDILGMAGVARVVHLVVGPVVAAIAVIAFWPVVRMLVRFNLALGLLLAGSALLSEPAGASVAAALAGAAVAVLALIPVARGNRFGGGWRAAFRR